MRLLVVSLLVAGCAPPVQPAADAPPPADAPLLDAPPPDGRPMHGERDGQAAVVVGDQIVWTAAPPGCSHEDTPPCYPSGPSVLRARFDGSEQEVLLSSFYGAWAVAADGPDVFAVAVRDDFSQSLVRLDGEGASTELGTLDALAAIGLDATHVFWDSDGSIMRASRAGDGSDVVAVAVVEFNIHQMAVEGGWLYVANRYQGQGLWRAPAAGGTAELLLEGSIGGFAVRDGTIYAARAVASPTPQIVARHPDGAEDVLVDGIQGQVDAVSVDGDSLFWLESGSLYWTTIGAGDREVVVSHGAWVHAITPAAILVDFGDQGFNAIPR